MQVYKQIINNPIKIRVPNSNKKMLNNTVTN
jgi:hypothetical protein